MHIFADHGGAVPLLRHDARISGRWTRRVGRRHSPIASGGAAISRRHSLRGFERMALGLFRVGREWERSTGSALGVDRCGDYLGRKLGVSPAGWAEVEIRAPSLVLNETAAREDVRSAIRQLRRCGA